MGYIKHNHHTLSTISNQNLANGYQNDPNSQSLPHPLETCHSLALNSEGDANDCHSYLLPQNGLNSDCQSQSHRGDPSPSINSEGVANECCSSTHLPILQNGTRSDSLDTDHSLGVNSDSLDTDHLQILHRGSESQPHPLDMDNYLGLNSDEDDNATVELDYFNGVLKFINEMLMEEDDLINKPCMFHDCSALQAAEQAFYDALGHKSPDDDFTGACSSNSPSVDNFVELNQSLPNVQPNQATSEVVTEKTKNVRDGLAGTKNSRENTDSPQEGRSNKQLASFIEEPEQSEMYDKALLCPCMNPSLHKDKLQQNGQSKRSNAGRQRGERRGSTKKVVDLRNLLTRCAQAVASSNIKTADQLLKQIRQHSSPYGDGIERMAHYFADAIEARLAGTGTALYAAFTTGRITAADILKAYQEGLQSFALWESIFPNQVFDQLRGLANVPDETVAMNCPRDTVLNLIKKINPDIFVQGVLNGTYNFFVTGFREAMFHFSALFDMFEAVISREDQERRLFEQEVFARDVMNVIACEGIARIDRLETYKQ
ncbi:hypothetical protein RJ639_002837 [Escallonia herrerae]|uniref:Uncharacterized protein n=1 Tax=Escallonia herrerae TaxID=1293975 RepID=A0AA89AX78_9ASTE|nr:hypothetical protein RJ639_002837 [Escallonia herrerae]